MASRGVNKVILVGNLGQDPEVRYTQNGKAIANLSLATSESWNDQQGQKQEKTEWHRVVIFSKLAEVAGEYLRKGSQVYIEGKLQTRKWQNQQGQDQYTTEIVVDGFDGKMQMLGGRDGGQQQQPQKQKNGFQQQQQMMQTAPDRSPMNQQQPNPMQTAHHQQAMQQQGQAPNMMPQPQGGFDDDIPF